MNANNKRKYVSWSNTVELTFRPWLVSVAIAVGGMAILGIAITTNQTMLRDAKKNEKIVSVSAKHQSASQPQNVVRTVSSDQDLEVIRDFVLDGLEFAVAGAEISNQLGPYRQIGNTVSWFAKEISKSDETRLLASELPSDAGLVANPFLSRTEREMANWLVQTSWTH